MYTSALQMMRYDEQPFFKKKIVIIVYQICYQYY